MVVVRGGTTDTSVGRKETASPPPTLSLSGEEQDEKRNGGLSRPSCVVVFF